MVQKKHPLEVFRQTRIVGSRQGGAQSMTSPPSPPRGRVAASARSAAPARAPLKERTLRFSGETVMVLGGLIVVLLVVMFWAGYMQGKRVARSEMLARSGGESAGLPLRSDAKEEWDPPRAPAASEPGAGAGESAAAGTRSGESPPTGQATGKVADGRTGKGPEKAASEKPPAEQSPAATGGVRTPWVVLAVSYPLGREELALSWRDTLKDAGFDHAAVYKLGKSPDIMLGLCVGEGQTKEELEPTLKRVIEFKSKDETPFKTAFSRRLTIQE